MKKILLLALLVLLVLGGSIFLWPEDDKPSAAQDFNRTHEPFLADPSPASASQPINRVANPLPSSVSSLAAGELEIWWGREKLVKSLTNQFALEFDSYRSTFLLDCEQNDSGDQGIKVSQTAWRMFHPFMKPTLSMFEEATQAEKWVFSQITQRAGTMAQEYGGRIPEGLSVEEGREFRRKLRDESLYASPEFILNDKFGSDWDQHPELAKLVHQRWVEQIKIAIPVQAELDVRQRCAMHLYPPAQREDTFHIWNEIQMYELNMKTLSQEFHDDVLLIIEDFKNEQE